MSHDKFSSMQIRRRTLLASMAAAGASAGLSPLGVSLAFA